MEKGTTTLKRELKDSRSFDEYRKRNAQDMHYPPLADYLTQQLHARGLHVGEVLQNAVMERPYGTKLLRGTRPFTERDKVLALALSIGLSPEETDTALKYGRFAPLSPRGRDAAVLFALEQHYSVMQLNDLLEAQGWELLHT